MRGRECCVLHSTVKVPTTNPMTILMNSFPPKKKIESKKMKGYYYAYCSLFSLSLYIVAKVKFEQLLMWRVEFIFKI